MHEHNVRMMKRRLIIFYKEVYKIEILIHRSFIWLREKGSIVNLLKTILYS